MAPYTFLEDAAEVSIPESGLTSRALFDDESLKVIAFGFAAGHEMAVHSTPMAALLQFLKGEAEITLGGEKRNVRAGSLVHMMPGLPHGILARTPVVMLLWMLKQVRLDRSL